jgi:hypothetical protein
MNFRFAQRQSELSERFTQRGGDGLTERPGRKQGIRRRD